MDVTKRLKDIFGGTERLFNGADGAVSLVDVLLSQRDDTS